METAVWMDRERKSEAEREMEREWKGEKINVRIKKSLMNINASSLSSSVLDWTEESKA